MNRSELDGQADQIEMILQDHKVPARVTGGTITPRWVQFVLQPAPGIEINSVAALSREIAIALSAPTAHVKAEGGAVKVEVPRTDSQPVNLMRLMARLPPTRIPMGGAVLGLADDGAPLLVCLPSPDAAHLLVVGDTGSGKTSLVQTMIVSLALLHHRRQLQFVLLDLKGRVFDSLSDLPHLLRPIVTQPDQAVDALADLITLMGARDQQRVSEPHIVVVIDELADLVQSGDSAIPEGLSRLVQRGREAGIHVIGATRKPSSTVIGSIVTANFPVRLVGRVDNTFDARVATGTSSLDASRLQGRGDFVAVTGAGDIHFQAAYLVPEAVSIVVQHLKTGLSGSEIVRSAGSLPHQ